MTTDSQTDLDGNDAAADGRIQKSLQRAELLDDACGVGLWDAIMPNGDALHAQAEWTWSPEFRRLLGYETSQEYPNVVQSWSDRLHPDDIDATFAAFNGHMEDKTGKTRYDVTYRLKVRDGSYKWFRATGGCKHLPNGVVRACGSLSNVDDFIKLKRSAQEDSEALDAVGKALSALASGDLTLALNETMPEHFEGLRHDFNAAVEKLRQSFDGIVSSARKMDSEAKQISQSATELHSRAAEQARSAEKTSAALNDVTGMVRETADFAANANSLAGETRDKASSGASIVSQAVEAVLSMEQSSSEIADIVRVIDEISFQTNLLALNAGVEAARAGEAGRGFAVVAQEVRALAQRSSDSANNIKDLISEGNAKASVGVSLVEQTGESLEEILTRVTGTTDLVNTIAASAQTQSTGLASINAEVSQMDELTQKNADMMERTTIAMKSLAEEARGLLESLSRFRTGSASDFSAQPQSRQPRTPQKVA